MKVCIVGSGGYIGSSLKKHFENHSIDVIQITSQQDQYSTKTTVSYHYSDLNNLDDCVSILSDVDVLFYLCSPNQNYTEQEPGLSINVVLMPLINILNAKRILKKLKIIYFSTAQIFNGVPWGKLVDHDTRPKSNNYYGLLHEFGERLIEHNRQLTDQHDMTSLRLTNSFGFMCNTTCNWRAPVINEFISDAFDTQQINSKSNGSPVRDFIEISHVINACQSLMSLTTLPKNVICGSGIVVNLAYVIFKISKTMSEKYSSDITVNSNHRFVKPKIQPIPRFNVNAELGTDMPISLFDQSLEKAILDYESFQ